MSSDHVSPAPRGAPEPVFNKALLRQSLETFLDPKALDGLEALDMDASGALMVRFVGMSAALLRKTLPRLEALAPTHDLAGVAFEAHKLKSAATSIGARPLELACEAVSRLALAKPTPEPALAQAQVGVLIAESRRLLEALTRVFPAQPPSSR